MDVFVVALMITVVLTGSLYEAKAVQPCGELNGTNCSSCIEKGNDEGNDCYWCPATGQCLEWNWAKYPGCSGDRYFYGQCNLNGVGIIILFSVGIFLLVVVIVSCCICCCCCYIRRRRRMRMYIVTTDERQRLFQARRDEIRHKYGLDTNDSTV